MDKPRRNLEFKFIRFDTLLDQPEHNDICFHVLQFYARGIQARLICTLELSREPRSMSVRPELPKVALLAMTRARCQVP